MPTTLYGSNLDMLGRADIADRDQVLKGRTASQNYLAQLAAERTRRRGVEAQYDVGLRGQETNRLDTLARQQIADMQTGRMLEAAGINANAGRYNTDVLAALDRERMKQDLELAKLPKPVSEEMQMALLKRAEEKRAAHAEQAKLAKRANIANTPSIPSAIAGLIVDSTLDKIPGGQTFIGPIFDYFNNLRPNATNFRDASESGLRDMEAQGIDTSQLNIDESGFIKPPEVDPTGELYLQRSNRVFGPPLPGEPGYTPSTAGSGTGKGKRTPPPPAEPTKNRIPWSAIRDAAVGTLIPPGSGGTVVR